MTLYIESLLSSNLIKTLRELRALSLSTQILPRLTPKATKKTHAGLEMLHWSAVNNNKPLERETTLLISSKN